MSIVGNWKLNGNANDALGVNNGTPNNVSYKQGIENQCAYGDGTPSDIEIRNTDAFKTLTQGSIVGWINAPDSSYPTRIFAVHPSNFASIGLFFWLYHLNNKIALQQRNDGTGGNSLLFTTTNNVITYNKWHQVVYTVNASGNKLYIDSKQVPITYTTGNAATNYFFDDIATTQYYGIDSTKYNSLTINRYLYGKIDDVRLYNHALSPAEIKNLYMYYKGFF